MKPLKKSIISALQVAPREPFLGDPLLRITKAILPSTSLKAYNLSSEQINSFERYIGITAYALARHAVEFFPDVKRDDVQNYAQHAADILMRNINEANDDLLATIEEKTMQELYGSRTDIVKLDKKKEEKNSLKEDSLAEHALVAEMVASAKERLKSKKGGGGGSVIRAMMAVYNEIIAACKAKGIQPHLKNLTLGDVTGKNMPQSVVDVMGYDPMGKKGLAIGVRALAYEAMLYEAGVDFDPHRYDLAALGWIGLRKRFVEYGEQFGLYAQNEVKESMIGEGGAGTLLRVFTALHMHLKNNMPDKKFSVYFPNPAFRMVGDAAGDAGFSVIEVATQPTNGFFPDTVELDSYLTHHPECKVFIFIPIGNPNASFPLIKKVEDLLRVLEKHSIYLVNDFAYLGTGDEQKNKDLARVLSTYKKRIDSYSMSKIFGRTGLRCGCAVTTDAELAAQFSPAAKHIQLGLSYPMEQEAMAIWDYVSQEDRNALNNYYKIQQNNLLQALLDNDKKRIEKGKHPLFNTERPIFNQAGLYVYIALYEGIDAFDVLQETGYVGVPDSAFSNSSLTVEGPYMRFALGVERV